MMSMVFKLTSVKGIAPTRRVPRISLFPGGYDGDRNAMLLLKLDEGEGVRAVDYSDQGNDGEILGAKWTSGKYGYGLHFDGINDRVIIPYDPTLNLRNNGAGDFCIEAWAKIEFDGTQRIVEKPNAYYLGLLQHGKKKKREIRFNAGIWTDGELRQISTGWNYKLDEWLHVAFQRNQAGYLSLIVNGVEDAVSEFICAPPDINENDLFIGSGVGGHYFQGDMDEIRLSDCYREIASLDPNK